MIKLFVQILTITALTFALTACTSSKEITETEQPQITKILNCQDKDSSHGIINGSSVNLLDPDSKRAVLLIIKKGSEAFSCTGVPVSDRIILTAAHCVKDVSKTEITVVFYPEMTCASGYNISKTIRSVNTVIHKDYDGTAQANADLALVKLASTIPNEYSVASLYDGKSALDNDKVLMIGYGVSQESLNDSLHLRKTIKSYRYDSLVRDQNISFIQSGASGGVCSGDSGGPIYVESKGEYKLIAVNSIVSGKNIETACHEASIAMYTPYFTEWIQSNILKLTIGNE